MAKSTAEILDIIDEYGLPAAIKAIVRVYNEVAPVNDPHSAFWPPFANACVHVARWELGHNKDGEQRFEPKRVTDPRFRRLVSGLIPPGGTSLSHAICTWRRSVRTKTPSTQTQRTTCWTRSRFEKKKNLLGFLAECKKASIMVR